ncbi:hypothetical protein E3N88_44575 [Mikania micrantha]|uniref:Uncharacterized protein n=1 Tax=Mikania micrantha TaxID=192012 RepID=A0A5N6LBM6_9ASTR|nr:hypothetical protein E3N88_44575 [Mikania micrantha]
MALLAFKPAHNLPAELSSDNDPDFAPIILFLQKSRYSFALIVQPLVYESHHQQFWASCSVSSSSNGRTLNATIDAHPISITVETICRHLKLNDAGGKVSFTKDEVASTFKSMGVRRSSPFNNLFEGFLQQILYEELGTSLSLLGNTYKMPLVSSKVFVQLKKKGAQFSGNFTPLLPSMESHTPEGDSSVNPTDAEPTPSTFVGHPIKITYKRKRTHVQLSTAVQAPFSKPRKKKVKRTDKGTVPPKVKATPIVTPQVLPLESVATPNQPDSPQSMSPYIPENIQRDSPIIESASDEATPLNQRLSPRSPGSYHPEMPPTHTTSQAQGTSAIAVEEPLSPTFQTLMRVVTQLQAKFPDPEPNTSEVDPRSEKGINADEATTTDEPSQVLQDSGTGNRTSSAATNIGEDFFEALLNEGNPGCQETTSGGGGAGDRLRTPSPHDSTQVDEGTKIQELTATITSLQARVAHLEAEVTTLRLQVQTKDATILDLRRRPPVLFQPFHPDPATTTFISTDATKKGENTTSAGSGSQAREEEAAQDVNPSIVTLTTEWDDFLGTYFHVSSTSSSSYFEATEAAKETEQEPNTTNVSLEPQSPVGTHLSPSWTKSPSETAAQVAMEDTIQEQPSISMEPVSPPTGTKATEDLSSSPELSVETNKESTKMVGQPKGAVNAKVNSEAAAASEGPVILDVSSSEELSANEPVGEATGDIASGVKLTADDKGKRKLTPEEEAEQEERIPKKNKGRPDTSMDDELIRLSALLQEKGYDIDEVLSWSVPRMTAELDKVQQQEQAAAATKAQKKLTKAQKDKAYRDSLKAFLLEYGFHARQLGPMKNSTMDMHIREIKAKVARGELPSIAQIRAQKASLMRGLGLGGGARIEFPFSGTGIRHGEEVMCGEETKAMFPNMFPLNPKEEQTSPPSSPFVDNMPISSPTATTGAAVGFNVEDQQAIDQRNQATAQERPRFTRKKSITRRKKRTSAISSDSEPDSPPPGPKAKPGASIPKDHPKDLHDLQHHHTYVPVERWSYNREHKEFTLFLHNKGIKTLHLAQLFVLADPFVFDLENLPLENPDNGQEGRQALRWVKARAQVLRGEKFIKRIP